MSKKHKRAAADPRSILVPEGVQSGVQNTVKPEQSDPAIQRSVSDDVRQPEVPAPNQPVAPSRVEDKGATELKTKWIQRLVRWRILAPTAQTKSEQNSALVERQRSRLRFRLILETLKTVIEIIIGLFILALIVITWIEARKPVTEIRNLVLPKDWEDRGDTPEAISQEIRKRATDAINAAGRNSEFIGNMELHEFEVDLSGNQVSSRSLVHLWRDKLYHNRRILEGGVVANKEGGLILWVTLTNSAGKWRTITRTLSGTPSREQILDEFARVVLAATEQDVFAWLLLDQGHHEEMDRYFWQEAMDDDLTPERRANFWVARAASLIVRRRREDSDRAFREALRYDHNGSTTNFYWAALLKMQGRVDEAVDKYRQALQENPKYALAYNNLGRIYFDRGDTDTGMQYFLKAVVADPKCFEAWNNLGESERRKASPDWNQVFEWYFQSLAANPNYVPVLVNLCGALTTREKPQEALPFCQRARELSPKDPNVLTNLRGNLYVLGRKTEAMAVNDEILSLPKEEPTPEKGKAAASPHR
jgi:tetratricopeptide (TPR) repeat protein